MMVSAGADAPQVYDECDHNVMSPARSAWLPRAVNVEDVRTQEKKVLSVDGCFVPTRKVMFATNNVGVPIGT
jgi:hypothetical protein